MPLINCKYLGIYIYMVNVIKGQKKFYVHDVHIIFSTLYVSQSHKEKKINIYQVHGLRIYQRNMEWSLIVKVFSVKSVDYKILFVIMYIIYMCDMDIMLKFYAFVMEYVFFLCFK